MRKNIIAWVCLTILGVVTISLPDNDDSRLFSFSASHGPSLVDGIGIVTLLLGWLLLITPIWKKRKVISSISGTSIMNSGLFLGGISTGLVIASVMSDIEYWWAIGAAVLCVLQLVLFMFVAKKTRA